MRFSIPPLYAADGARLDDLDLQILRVLHQDGRTPNVDLAGEIGLSASATLQRVRRLEANGAIKRYLAEADEALFEAWSFVLINVELSQEGHGRRREFEANIQAAREIVEALELAGAPDYLLKGAMPSSSHWPSLRTTLDPEASLIKRASIAPAVRTVKLRSPHPMLFGSET